MSRAFRLATRRSPLALWQARAVARRLRLRHPGLDVELVPMVSSGDKDRVTALYDSGTVGMFVKEIQAAVLAGEADAGVHSCKDLPTTLPKGLALVGMLERADPRDALIGAASVHELPQAALVGTSSLRRQVQLARLRPDLRFAPMRGNVESRLRKLAGGEVAATVLAMAGLKRLGLIEAAHASPLHPWDECVPAPGQGAIALDCRTDDPHARSLLGALTDRDTMIAVTVEREVLGDLAGGCSLPLGCFVRRSGSRWLACVSLGVDGSVRHRFELRGQPAELGRDILTRLR
jgi:hydroxymethylbilane synthase